MVKLNATFTTGGETNWDFQDITLHEIVLKVLNRDKIEVGEEIKLTSKQLDKIAGDYITTRTVKDWKFLEFANIVAFGSEAVYRVMSISAADPVKERPVTEFAKFLSALPVAAKGA